MSERYLQYALSTIMHRALPDARDGLKPVHRRILYAMRELKLGSNSGFRKSAKISGDVMGNYHPHGDQAIYDALARLAQGFNVRYPLVDGQGNFGNIDGDNPAASRYTEARLTEAAEALLEGLAENSVDFQDNYDGTLTEPVVLPASLPNLLANGAKGVAVGMATDIPPHNIGELCDACLHLLKFPEARTRTLLKSVAGPDFPTGGVIVEAADSIREVYENGRGSIRLRARWDIEKLGHGNWRIVVTEIPYQVKKSELIERIASLVLEKKVQALADVRDESAEDVRIVLEPRTRNVDAQVLMETLFRSSALQVNVPVNLNALVDGRTPKVCSLRELLRIFLDHRRDVLVRRSRHRVEKIDRRLEILEGYVVAFLNLDRVIEIIRYEDNPKAMLMQEFELSDVQAEAILNMRLRSLRKLEEAELKREREALQIERADLDDLLSAEELQWKRITEEIREVRQKFGADASGGARRTALAEPPQVEVEVQEEPTESEPVTVVCSKMGWIRAMKGNLPLDQEFKHRDGDEGKFVLHAETSDKLLLFGTNGRFYTLRVSSLPDGRGTGEPVRAMVDLPYEADIVSLFVHDPDQRLVVASANGFGFAVPEADVVAWTKNGKQVLNVGSQDEARACAKVNGDLLAVVGTNRRMLMLKVEELPEMTRGKGVRLQKYNQSGELSDLKIFESADGLKWADPAGRTRTERDIDRWMGKRATVGRTVPRGFPSQSKFT